MVLAAARAMVRAATRLHRHGGAGRDARQPLPEGFTATIPPLLHAASGIHGTHGERLFCQIHADGYSAQGKLLLQIHRW